MNAGLAWFFRGFNRFFDRTTELYGGAVSKVLRLSVMAVVVYGGLLALTYWQFLRTPTGFIPQQDKGYLIQPFQHVSCSSKSLSSRAVE